ncbi:MAG: cysteine desulfurase DndA [Phycisphaerales bacterium]|nr:cysteine desulfurase DndA [Phycisphaerales bacterium]
MSVYLDCASTTPIDPRVLAEVVHHLEVEFGNAGSRTHDFGARARRAVERARDQVAAVVAASRGEVLFTSGATESNNLVILGLAEHGRRTGRMHLVSTQIEHNAVLEPLQELERRGFALTLVSPTAGGWVDPEAVRAAVREDTLLVSVMQVNNETGVIQPIEEIAQILAAHPAYFHLDAAQGFGKEIAPLRNGRIDLISVSGHKLHAPKGVGALIARRRGAERPPLTPLMFGGGQERGLRPGTLPVHLIVGLGKAAELALAEAEERAAVNRQFRARVIEALRPLEPVLTGDQERVVPHVLNLSFPGVEAEAAMEALADVVAVSNGSACTSGATTCSHVLGAMGMAGERSEGAIRLSWCHMTPEPDWPRVVAAIRQLRVQAVGGA